MITQADLLALLRPLHIWITKTGHIQRAGHGFAKLRQGEVLGRRFLEVFEVLQPAGISNVGGLRGFDGQVIRVRLREVPDIVMRAFVVDDQSGGVILDMTFGFAVIDAVRKFDLTAQDFAPSDLAVELLFLQEAKSSAMAASFSLNSRLDGARLAAETEALTDGLTGLHNRRALDHALNRLGQSQTEYAVLHIDLDLFKLVNDTLGHAVGDAVLKRVAGILRRHTRKDDLVVRAGGDEFIIVCPGLTSRERLSALATKVINDISEPFDIEGHVIEISASIGMGVSLQSSGEDPLEISEIADIALYAAKRSGRGRHVFWSPDLGTALVDLDIPHVALR